MKMLSQNIKKLFVITVALLSLVVFGSKGWAALGFVKPSDVIHQEETIDDSNIPQNLPKSHAPEPTTMALFGSGILGMVVSFVRRTYYLAKRAIDIAGCIIACILLLPLCLLAAILIKMTSKGPILFKQTRLGKNGSPFEIYKFRTMKVDAEKHTGPVWASQNDNRLIPVGNFLRKTHIDEIPQFINVLKGEMSIIGPRPERPFFVEQLKSQVPGYEKRLSVKPGITGLAQVWHRYDETIEDVKKKIKYDLLYIKNVCLWTDLRIMLRTFRVVITGEGAR